MGNITEQVDNAQQTHFFQNAVVDPKGKYEYDSLYRLLKATGREHAATSQITHADGAVNTPVPFTNNSTAVRNYTEEFDYDAIGNILQMIHRATITPKCAAITMTQQLTIPVEDITA